MKIKFDCTQDQFEALHRAADRVRATNKTVTVDEAALEALLAGPQQADRTPEG